MLEGSTQKKHQKLKFTLILSKDYMIYDSKWTDNVFSIELPIQP